MCCAYQVRVAIKTHKISILGNYLFRNISQLFFYHIIFLISYAYGYGKRVDISIEEVKEVYIMHSLFEDPLDYELPSVFRHYDINQLFLTALITPFPNCSIRVACLHNQAELKRKTNGLMALKRSTNFITYFAYSTLTYPVFERLFPSFHLIMW
ncbi:CYFA0S23e00595g1_1 [Cyberlindnera fabianii]|uniref:CYFA0S23e00595g1_1 n=1 Tax=Cyberlindnera fabianii TaxID=36022 RepID=A0A061BHD8_CYBFA|nr:CYFA0S23e00595g1_1 [Cyberlindnera fabianii]